MALTPSSGAWRSGSTAIRQFLASIPMDITFSAAAPRIHPSILRRRAGLTTSMWAIRCLIRSPDCSLRRRTPTTSRRPRALVRREAYNFYFQDAWKVTSQLTVNYGLRYEVNSRIHEATKRTSLPVFTGANGQTVPYWDRTATQTLLINPQPPYNQDWNGWGPRLALDYAVGKHTVLHAGGSIATLIPNLWQDNFLTAAIPYVFAPTVSAEPGFPVPFQDAFVPVNLPTAYNIQGQPIFATGRTQTSPRTRCLTMRASRRIWTRSRLETCSCSASQASRRILPMDISEAGLPAWITISPISNSMRRMSPPQAFIWRESIRRTVTPEQARASLHSRSSTRTGMPPEDSGPKSS